GPLVARSRPALAAAAGGVTLLLATALLDTPNVPVALGFFVAFFVASALQFLDRGTARSPARWLGGTLSRGGWISSRGTRQYVAGESMTAARPGGPFERFDERAKRVLSLAQEEAIRLNH